MGHAWNTAAGPPHRRAVPLWHTAASVEFAELVREFDRDIVLRDGARVRLRPIRAEDAPLLVALHDRLSQQTAYQRFFTLMRRLPPADEKSRAVLEEMKADEARHATSAIKHGGGELPEPAKRAMRLSSKAMTETAYWL